MRFSLTCFLVLVATSAVAQLEIIVKNIKNDKGDVRVGLFKDKESFLKNAAYGKVVKSTKGELKVIFDNLPDGTYGISVIHDENSNEKLDTNMIGIPKEGFGFGNNSMGTFGPPSFEKASVAVEPGKTSTSISLKYF